MPVVATSRLISELVANAITYGRADEEWRVRVEWFRDGTSPAGRRRRPWAFGGTVVAFLMADAWPD
ncbi:hypothetical protein [Streptomyces sp. DSM 118878]